MMKLYLATFQIEIWLITIPFVSLISTHFPSFVNLMTQKNLNSHDYIAYLCNLGHHLFF